MRNLLLAILCILVATSLSGCASGSGLAGDSANNSMLLIGATLQKMDPDGHVYNEEEFLVADLSVKNIDTGDVYRMTTDDSGTGIGIKTLPAGSYCLYSVNAFDYCGKPFFKLNPHKVTNAGYFVFGVDSPDHRYKLVKALVYSDYLFNQLTKAERDAMARFMNNQE